MFNKSIIAVTGALLIGCALAVNAADTAVIIVSHGVADFGEWKKRFDAGKDARKKAGLTERYVMRDANKPNVVIVVLESATVENAKKFVSDPAFQERVKKVSTSGPAEIKIGTTSTGSK